MRLWILFAFLLSSCGSEDDDVGARTQQCELLRERIVDLRLSSAHNLGKDVEQHREAMRQALGDGFLDTCTRTFSAGQADCVMGATDSAGAASCFSSEGTETK